MGQTDTMRLLYVEDHVRFRAMVIRDVLSGHDVTTATTLAEARSLLAEGMFDAVLLDHDLPDGKGVELLKELQHRGMAGRVIAVSSREENNAALLAGGAHAAVSKMAFGGIREVLEQMARGET